MSDRRANPDRAATWVDADGVRPSVLRRPRDLASEVRGARASVAARPDGEAPAGWPEGFAGSARDREALLVLSCLPSLVPRALLALSGRHGSAGACLEAVRRGEGGSAGDRERARSIEPSTVSAGLAGVGARLVAVGDRSYPSNLLDLADPPAALFVRGRWPIDGYPM